MRDVELKLSNGSSAGPASLPTHHTISPLAHLLLTAALVPPPPTDRLTRSHFPMAV